MQCQGHEITVHCMLKRVAALQERDEKVAQVCHKRVVISLACLVCEVG